MLEVTFLAKLNHQNIVRYYVSLIYGTAYIYFQQTWIEDIEDTGSSVASPANSLIPRRSISTTEGFAERPCFLTKWA